MLQEPQDASVSCTNGESLYSECIYTCNQGYFVEGYNSITCQVDGTWDNEPPACKRKFL